MKKRLHAVMVAVSIIVAAFIVSWRRPALAGCRFRQTHRAGSVYGPTERHRRLRHPHLRNHPRRQRGACQRAVPPARRRGGSLFLPAHYVVISKPGVPVRFVDAHDPSSETTGAVWVYRSDGSRQGQGGGVSVEKMERELTSLGRLVHVYSGRKRHDGMAHAAVLGESTGRINLYEIDTSGLDLALAAGFRPIGAEIRRANGL